MDKFEALLRSMSIYIVLTGQPYSRTDAPDILSMSITDLLKSCKMFSLLRFIVGVVKWVSFQYQVFAGGL